MLNVKDYLPLRLCLQTVFSPSDTFSSFEKLLRLLQELGFWGIELNLPDLDVLSPDNLAAMLGEHDLKLTYLATGAFAKARSLSLSTSSEISRISAVNGALENADYAAEMHAGIILGFFKGGPQADSATPEHFFCKSVSELCARKKSGVPVLLEATNQRETCVIRTLDEAASVCSAVENPDLRILPDTYHMFYEETDPRDSILRYRNRIENLHLSDDNRYFPGLGSIDFGEIFRFLQSIDYQGTLALEGNIRENLEADLIKSTEALCRFAEKR